MQVAARLSRHPSGVLFVCALLFGVGYGLGHERLMVPSPEWLSPMRYRFCLAIMVWTALTQRTPVQMLAWTTTDFAVLSMPFFAGIMFVPNLDLENLLSYQITLGMLSAGALIGVSVCQGVMSLLPHSVPSPSSNASTAAAS